ncbi:MAG: thioredoxin family protein [Cyclobacteriaceae bacterium]|nr:thioredoxin family protein [Cyclobacteriaceae bacterium]
MKTLLIIIGFGIAIMGMESSDFSNGFFPADKSKGIEFLSLSWEKALSKAKAENKLIFLDAYASWCGPCKLLKSRTFTDEEAGEFFNKHFVNVAIDMEKGDGRELAKKFKIRAYPTLIFVDGDGNPVVLTEGFVNPGQLLKFGNHALSKHKN